MKILAKGIDVSTFQFDIDWKKVKADGIEFAIIRGGYGRYELDEKFEQNYKNAKAAGVPVGVYHYSYADTVAKAKQEAQFTISYLKGKQLEYPVAFDIEEPSQYKLSGKLVNSIIKAYCDTVAAAGYCVVLYSNKNWLTTKINVKEAGGYDVWLAQYNNKVTYTGTYTMWQYSSKGSVMGIRGNVDMNYSYVDYPKYIKSKGLNGFTKETTKPTSGNSNSSTGTGSNKDTSSNKKSKFKAGDVVKITGSKYYNGLNIPTWVKAKNWIVESVSGDKVIINKSADGANKIMSPINAKDIALVKNSTSSSSSSSSSKPTTTTNTIKKGCVVKITGKKYYDGQKIPLWVRLKQWVVVSVSGNRVVIDKDTSGKYSIMSAVNKNDLKFIRNSK